nr:P-type ATPase [Tanacetum cinerariifolium]
VDIKPTPFHTVCCCQSCWVAAIRGCLVVFIKGCYGYCFAFVRGCLDEAVMRYLPNVIMVFYCLLSEFGTGDGTNDALELHETDIGLPMGIAGTEEAKESADVIILDNFSTIAIVAKWGRSM